MGSAESSAYFFGQPTRDLRSISQLRLFAIEMNGELTAHEDPSFSDICTAMVNLSTAS